MRVFDEPELAPPIACSEERRQYVVGLRAMNVWWYALIVLAAFHIFGRILSKYFEHIVMKTCT